MNHPLSQQPTHEHKPRSTRRVADADFEPVLRAVVTPAIGPLPPLLVWVRPHQRKNSDQ